MNKAFLKNILFSIITLVIFFSLLELTFRAIYPFWYKKYSKNVQEEDSNFYPRDPVLGWILPTNSESMQAGCGQHYLFKTNSYGLRDKDYVLAKPKSTFRILCLGDSITEGAGVNNDETFPKVLEKDLNAIPGRSSVEVLNGGVLDYGTEQEYLFLKEKGLKYNPDMVILGYYLNDARGFLPSKAINIKGYKEIVNRSKFLYLLDRMIMKYKVKYQYKKWDKNRTEFWMPLYKVGTWRTNSTVRKNLIELADKDWGLAWTQKGWENTNFYLDKFVSLAKEKNFKFVVVCFPAFVQLYANKADSYMFQPQEKLRQYCQKNGLLFVDLLPRMREFKDSEILLDHCHLTKQGNQLTAQVIYDSVRKELP